MHRPIAEVVPPASEILGEGRGEERKCDDLPGTSTLIYMELTSVISGRKSYDIISSDNILSAHLSIELSDPIVCWFKSQDC